MELHIIDREHLDELEKVVNFFRGVILFVFGKEKGFYETHGVFIRMGDDPVAFMPRHAGRRSEWIELEDMLKQEDGDTFYWTDVDEYNEWKERQLRLILEVKKEKEYEEQDV